MRSLSSLTIILLTTVTVGAAASYAQTTPPSNCGVETWSTDKMAYVTVPCSSSGTTAPNQAKAPGAPANCGIETWSTAEQKYVSTPCVGGTTYENPNGASQ
jgi:hypothetical protein